MISDFGQDIFYHDSLDSTNEEAWRMIRQGRAREGTIIRAAFQSAGKGQQDTTWHSENGKNLLFSLILKPALLPVSKQFLLNKAISLALYDAITQLAPGKIIAIKWPNDILAERKKIAGILIENAITGMQLQHAVIGIGININQQRFPKTILPPCSLSQINQQYCDTELCFGIILKRLHEKVADLYMNKHTEIDQAYERALLGFNLPMFFRDKRRLFQATITGTDHYGRLLVREEGHLKAYDMKELSFVLDATNQNMD